MRIGISVVTSEGQNIWSNGLGQNVIFLARLFQRLPFVSAVLLLDVGNQDTLPAQVDLEALGLRLVRAREAGDEVDVIVEMAGALDPQWLDLMRARGKKVVYACCGQPYVGTVEPAVFDKPATFLRPERCDEIWLLPKDAAFVPMMRTLYRCEVHLVPYVWEPYFLQRRIDEIAALGFGFGYRARSVSDSEQDRKGLRVAIFEPNVSVAKSSSIPMLACDEAFRADPSSVSTMHVLNTLHLKDHPTMLYLANSLDLVRQHKALFHGRDDVAGFMAQHADAVVAHQWQNDQNYAYLDALYGDYPLVHNSPWLKDAGYYYEGFDAAEGGRQLRLAASSHEARLDDYRARSRRVFDAVDILNPANLEAYAHRLRRLHESASPA